MAPFNRAEGGKKKLFELVHLQGETKYYQSRSTSQKNNCIKLLKPTLTKVCHIYKFKGKP